ncbi:MAG: alpha/beta fold hydrolase [Hyphomonas sp.]
MLSFIALGVAAAGLGACVSSAAYTSRIEAKYPAAGQLIDVDGNAVHVLTAGETGTPVLMIHGASANAREFTWTLAPRLSAQHRILMADRPGHGHSERFSGAAALGAQAASMASVLDQLAPGEKAVLVGHSFGGAVALRVALDHPDRVKGLVLLAPVTHDWGGDGQTWYNSVAVTPLIGHMFSQLAPSVGPKQVGKGIEGVFEPADAPPAYLEQSAIDLLFRPPNFRANAQDVSRLNEELRAQSARYDALDIPITVFSGEKDTVISPPLHVGRLAQQVPVTVVELAEEGHMPHHAHGDAVAEVIRALASSEIIR